MIKNTNFDIIRLIFIIEMFYGIRVAMDILDGSSRIFYFPHLYLGLRSMTRALDRLNEEREPGEAAHTYSLFDSFVRIQFDAAIERRVFEQQPPRRIGRRHSIARALPRPEQQQQNQSTRPVRSRSIDQRLYVVPDDLRPVVDNYRNLIGKFLYTYSFF